jgi:hypothetical protein
VDFDSTYGTDAHNEQQLLFDVINSLGGNDITSEELLAAFGDDFGITDPLTTAQQL